MLLTALLTRVLLCLNLPSSPLSHPLSPSSTATTQGENAGQFRDLDASGRQALIDAKSPAQASSN